MYALITGASRGIGCSLAKELALHNINLILTCKNNIELLKALAEELTGSYHISCEAYACDVSDYTCVASLFEALSDKNISIDILVNNAAFSYVGLLQDMTIKQWQHTINTNLNSVFYMCKNAIPNMVHKHSGKIINVSSVWGQYGASMEVAYSATKGGVISFTKALAKELAPSNIQVNSVSFGAIDTDMNNHLSLEDKEILCDEIPSCRLGTSEEAAKMIYNVISSPSYLTGSNITMDGGWF